jgi:hypothetical protein
MFRRRFASVWGPYNLGDLCERTTQVGRDAPASESDGIGYVVVLVMYL